MKCIQEKKGRYHASVAKSKGQNTYVCIISVIFHEILRIRSIVNLEFSYISVWMRKF